MNRLENRVALVTGAASGISRATALRFAAEGAKIAALDVNEDGLKETVATIEDAGGEALAVRCDVASSESVQAAIAAAGERWGRIEIVFNGVGVSGRRWGDGPVHECTEDAWAHVLNLNLTSMFLMCKYVVPWMLRGAGGCIINLSSVLGIVGGDEDFATHAYAASKSGIIGLSRAMASYYAPQGIRVNVIAPGLVATAMSERARNNPHIISRLKDLQPLTSMMGHPDDVAGAAAYLASDDARFVTGSVLTVDGGWTVR
jgi:NAD(P)-dependent dehydrogenase (short-subunit alcohol dehydrogenase family)